MTNAQEDAVAKAVAYGIDVSILDANLRLTPTERLVAHQRALETALAVREAGVRYYAGLSETARGPRRP